MSNWTWKTLLDSMPDSEKRNINRSMKVWEIERKIYRICFWMRFPILKYIYMFWATLFEEGFRQTLKPRWGAITFGYLNDGFKPTIWHTWRQLTHDHTDKYTGIYPQGAPKSYKQAEEWHKKWAKEREMREILDENIFQ